MRLTIAAIVDRMNYIGSLTASQRADLQATCALLGHEPTGEQVMVNPPLDVCYWCATEYRSSPQVR